MSSTNHYPTRPGRKGPRRLATRRCALAVLHATYLVFAASTQAQTAACEQLKGVLAKRLPADVRGYSMEAMPANTPLPSGAKVIGTCEAGAYRIVYRRWGGGAVASPGAGSAAEPDPGSKSAAAAVPTAATAARTPAAAVPTEVAKPAPRVQAERPKQPAPSAPASTPLPALVPPLVAATPEPTPSVTRPASAPLLQRDEASAPKAPSALDFVLEHWPWGLAMILLLAVGLVWSAYRSRYDAAGLPRGPKL